MQGKQGVLIIASERIDAAALAATLRKGAMAAARLDIFEGAPSVHPDLLTLPNVVLTPHIASASISTRLAMAQLAADNLIRFLIHQRARTPLNPKVLTQLRC
jgi:glyoxylate/hydroxypyruvate/2-ketogluconate reductase